MTADHLRLERISAELDLDERAAHKMVSPPMK